VLFLGGWNAPIDPRPILDFLHVSINPALDPASLGMGLFFAIAIGVPLLILFISLVVWMVKPSWSFVRSVVLGFVLFNVIAVAAVVIWLFLSFEVVVGLFWFTVKVFTLAFTFVWMRGVLPRVRIDQLMGFAWKWLVEIALLNIFITAGAILLIQEFNR
jgi:NADH:ubiquinone oxidoreductase subunit H